MKKVLSKIRLWSILLLGLFVIALSFHSLRFPFFTFAQCEPYPECHPDINLDVRGYVLITGYLGLIDFSHAIDQRAPLLTTLIEGNCNPAITSLYQVYDWDWSTNTRDGLYPRPPDLPGYFDFATLTGLSTQPGQAILVPHSGYEIGGGYEVIVLFATSNSITLKYTPDDNVVSGYTIHLKNFNVDPALIACYNQLDQAGREELPALWAGEKIGEASGGEVLVAIRDTGSFMDPRWRFDWWQRCIPTQAKGFVCKSIPIQGGPIGPLPPPPPSVPLSCSPENPGDTDSRPVPCDACNQTELFTSSCATTFTVNDSVSYRRGDGAPEPPHCVETRWDGIVTIDPSDTTIPFVGKKGQENEQKYLADYFEGTNKYYADYQDLTEAMNHDGIFRKLAPQLVEDNFKKQMVYRAIQSKSGRIREGAIHDYLVEYNGESAQLSEFVGHFPPDDPKERGKWERETKWGKLWIAVPMFSREDTPGEILPYLGFRPLDKFEIINPEAQIEKVPHVARLYEISQAINQIILPLVQETTQAQGKIKTIIASAKEKVLGEKTLLAQGQGGCFHLGAESQHFFQTDGSVEVFVTVKVYSDGGDGHILFFINGASQGTKWGWNKGKKNPFVIVPQYTGSPITVPRGNSVSMTYGVKIDECGNRGNWDDITCIFSVDAEGNFSTNCGPGQPITPPICGLAGPNPVEPCVQPAITDPNPNDDLCCSPINIALSAVDIFENPEYDKCMQEPLKCQPPGCIPGIPPCRCKDPCDEMVHKDVSRRVGIMLLHPYLSEIWDYTTDVSNGFFNIFRPESVPAFEDLDAASSIFYSYDSNGVSPPGGDFYFPYLGGIQKAKEWVIETLNPSSR